MKFQALLAIILPMLTFWGRADAQQDPSMGVGTTPQYPYDQAKQRAEDLTNQMKQKFPNSPLTRNMDTMWKELNDGEVPQEQQTKLLNDFIRIQQGREERWQARQAGKPINPETRAQMLSALKDLEGMKGQPGVDDVVNAIFPHDGGNGGGQWRDGPWGRGGFDPGQVGNIGRIFNDNPNVQNWVGNTLSGNHDDKGAAAAYTRAVQLDPGNKDAWDGLSQSLFRLGDTRGAVEAGQRVLALDPNDAPARTMVALYASRVGQAPAQSGASQAAAQAAAGPAPGNFRQFSSPVSVNQSAARSNVSQQEIDSVKINEEAERYLGVRDPARAEEAARRAIAASAQNARARMTLVRSLLAQHKMQEALAEAARAVKDFPHDPGLAALNVGVLNSAHDYKDALAAADLALANNAGSAAVLWGKATALTGLQRYDEARGVLRQAADDPMLAARVQQAMQVPDDQLLAFLTGDA
ncbi:MAG: tetratricopeptide repeat protein, partial [Elusimicrobia bacterium]|nr:tetratricopeptide repeat protein [Elusimicrobiota bacterium]